MALTKIDDRGLTTPIDLLDNEKIRFGTGNDIEIYHTGSHGYIDCATGNLLLRDTGAGSFIIRTNDFNVQNAAGGETMIWGDDDAAVKLYYNGSPKFETTSTGVTVNGKMLVDGAVAYDAFTSSSIHVDGYICMGRTDTTVGVDNGIGGLRFYSNDTNINSGDFLNVAAIDVMADGDFLSGDAPTRITFKTMTDGTTTLEEALRIDSQQRIGIGISSPTEKLHVIGQVGGSNPTAGSKWDIARFVAHDYSATNSGGLTIGAYWNNTTVSGRKAYIQSSQNTNSGSTARELVLNPDGGDVSIGDGNLVVANTHGIDFSASEGGTGTSGEASLLKDYETGTWTPATGGSNWTAVSAIYVKVGGLVNLFFDITNATGANRTSIENLPFTPNSSHSEWHIAYYATGGSSTTVDAQRHGGYVSTSGALITTVGGGTQAWTIYTTDRIIGRATYYTTS
jgi:hypothetical protein